LAGRIDKKTEPGARSLPKVSQDICRLPGELVLTIPRWWIANKSEGQTAK
jgi:hypothetical protein